MERCPCCQARLAGALHCPRCQADLEQVQRADRFSDFWYTQALTFYFAQEVPLSLHSLSQALTFKKTPEALVFRGFVMKQQVPKVLALLTAQKIPEARELLGLLQALQPQDAMLVQVSAFAKWQAQKNHG